LENAWMMMLAGSGIRIFVFVVGVFVVSLWMMSGKISQMLLGVPH